MTRKRGGMWCYFCQDWTDEGSHFYHRNPSLDPRTVAVAIILAGVVIGVVACILIALART